MSSQLLQVRNPQEGYPEWFFEAVIQRNAQKTARDPLCLIFQSIFDPNRAFSNDIGLCNLFVATQRYYTYFRFVAVDLRTSLMELSSEFEGAIKCHLLIIRGHGDPVSIESLSQDLISIQQLKDPRLTHLMDQMLDPAGVIVTDSCETGLKLSPAITRCLGRRAIGPKICTTSENAWFQNCSYHGFEIHTMPQSDAWECNNQCDLNGTLQMAAEIASRGIVTMQYALGKFYRNQKFGPPTLELGFFWAHRAAKNGHAESQYDIALNYLSGTGVPMSRLNALFWFYQAACQGHESAKQIIIQSCETNVFGCIQDAEVSAYINAAKQGDLQAQIAIAKIYSKSFVCECRDQAIYWSYQAMIRGSREGACLFQQLIGQISQPPPIGSL